MKQLGFFDLPEHLKRLSEAGDPLEEMARGIDFEAFRPLLEEALAYSDGAKGGHPPYDPVAMFKVLILAAQKDTDARWTVKVGRSRAAVPNWRFRCSGRSYTSPSTAASWLSLPDEFSLKAPIENSLVGL